MRRAAFALIIVGLLALCGALAARAMFYYQAADFFCLWNGARLVLAGADPYDESQWTAATGGLYPDRLRGTATSACAARFAYPLWTAIALAPIGALPLEIAASAWQALSIGAAVGGTALSWRAAGGPSRLAPAFGVIVVTSQPFWLLIFTGQITGVMLGLIGTSVWALERGRDRTAGATLALLGLKPQIVGLFAPALLLRALLARRQGYLLAALTVGALLFASSLAVNPLWPASWAAELDLRLHGMTPRLPTVWGFARDFFGASAWGVMVLAALGGFAAMAMRRLRTQAGFAALVLPLSVLAAPYVYSYDYVVLALPWAVALSLAARLAAGPRLAFVFAVALVASLLPWVMYVIAIARESQTFSAVVPAATLVVLVLGAFGREVASVSAASARRRTAD